METSGPQEGLDYLIDSNIKRITEFISDSRNANARLKDFEVQTSQDFIAADRETKALDAILSAYEGEFVSLVYTPNIH